MARDLRLARRDLRDPQRYLGTPDGRRKAGDPAIEDLSARGHSQRVDAEELGRRAPNLRADLADAGPDPPATLHDAVRELLCLHRTRKRAARHCGGSSPGLVVEPAQLAGTTDAALVVQTMRAVPLSHRWCCLLLIGVIAAGSTSCDAGRGQRPVGYAEARTVVDRRCIECHSECPANHAFPIAPRGVVLDTALQMKQYARRIDTRVAVERTMPLGNMSGMTDEERWVLARWVEMGANVP